MPECIKCGRLVSLHYIGFEDEDGRGLCWDCLEVEERAFIFDKKLEEEFVKRMKEKYGFKDPDWTM